MKRYCILLLAACFGGAVQAQPSNLGELTPQEYENRKSLSVGYTYQHMELGNLNSLLQQSGYSSVSPGVSCITLTNSVHYNSGLGFFYAADIGLNTESSAGVKYKKSHYYRGEAGVAYCAVQLQRLACFAHMGLSYGSYNLRLYDRLPDSSMDRYIQGTADGKRMQTGLWGLNIGLQSRIYLGRSPYLGVGAGCIVPFGASVWRHDGGELKEAPSILPGTWYAQLKLGIEFHRRIIRLRNDDHTVVQPKAPDTTTVL